MRNFQEFIDEKIAVSFASKEEFKAFMELCMKNGKETKYMHFDENCIASIGFAGRSKDYVTAWLTPFHFKMNGHGWKLTPASEFLTQSTPTIEIFQSKQTVVCLKKQDNKVVAVGKAKCNPEDEFDFEFGATLAYQRMIGLKPAEPMKPPFDISDYVQGIKTLKNGMRIKKQESYAVGDRVLIKKKPNRSYGKEHYGKTGIIKEINPNSFNTRRYELDIDSKYYWFDRDIKGKVIE